MWVGEMLQNQNQAESANEQMELNEQKAVDAIGKGKKDSVDAAVKKSSFSEVEKTLDGDDSILDGWDIVKENKFERTPEEKKQYEQEQKEIQRQRMMYELDNIGIDLSISTGDLSILQKAIDNWIITDAWSRTWEENGRNYGINHLLENWLNNTRDLSDIDSYKNIIDQITWGEYKRNESIYNALNKKEFEIAYANIGGKSEVKNKVYDKYIQKYDTMTALELPYNEKVDFIQETIDPAVIEKLNATPLSSYGVFAEYEKYFTSHSSYIDKQIKISYDNIVNGISPDKLNTGEKLLMGDVFGLSDTQKADLAWKMIAIKPLSDTERKQTKLKLYNRSLWEIDDALTSWYTIVDWTNIIDTVKWTISKDLFSQYSSIIKKMRQKELLKTFDSFYRSKQQVPLMPSVEAPSTWDLTSTSWIGSWLDEKWSPVEWWSNVWRAWLNYNLEQWNVITNSLYFGLDSDAPMNMTIWAEWLDTFTGGKINISLTKGNQLYVIEGNYGGKTGTNPGKFDLLSTNLPSDISLKDNVNGTYDISIPPAYQDYDMSIVTESLNTGSNWPHPYDELLFPITIDNGNLSLPGENVYRLEKEELFQSWKYDLTQKWISYYTNMYNQYSFYSDRTLAKNIPITFNGWVDQDPFDNPASFISQNWSVLNSVDFSGSEKITTFWKDFQNKVDTDPDFETTFKDNPEQQTAQRLLLKLRTLESLQILYNNTDMRTKIESGKFQINVWDIRTDKKFVKTGVGSFSYIKE